MGTLADLQRPPHAFRDLSKDAMEELLSNYLLDSWSFSKVNAFARNEKAFEMSYIYREPMKSSASEVAGTAYHAALRYYFGELQQGVQLDVVELQKEAYAEIEKVKPAKWKLQKTTPTVEECILEATNTVNKLITNFLSDVALYTENTKEIVWVEQYITQFLTINGVDIPLPCRMVCDLVIRTNDNKIVVIDHKSKRAYTDEKELKFSIGKQAITYAKGFEAETGLTVDEVWFIENKSSKNQDKSPQLHCFKVALDTDTRRLYEALLYEPLKRMLEAISDPNYVYLINEADNFVDKAELYEFWAKTMIAEIGDFPIPENKKELIGKRLKKIRDAKLGTIDPKTIKEFRRNAAAFIQYDLTNKDMSKQEKIEHTLNTLGIKVKVEHTFAGYSSDTFLMSMSAGTSLSSAYKYRLDLAAALNVPSVRMMKDLYVHDGRAYLAVEAEKPRENNLLYDISHLQGDKIPLGVDNFGKTIFWDTANPSTPHMLICGSTGSGKSVSIISTLEYALKAGFSNVFIFDPKYEFTKYATHNITVVNDIIQIEDTLEALVKEMESRVKNGLNMKTLVIFDEFADAVANARSGKELEIYELQVVGYYKQSKSEILMNMPPREKKERVKVGQRNHLEENLRVLLQKGRSSGFRIIAATQRASAKVITGDAKVNFPVQVCFKVPKEVDSKVVIDEAGAEALAGKGDGLIKSPDYPGVIRFQAFFKPD